MLVIVSNPWGGTMEGWTERPGWGAQAHKSPAEAGLCIRLLYHEAIILTGLPVAFSIHSHSSTNLMKLSSTGAISSALVSP